MGFGGGSGGPTIFDLVSGALSKGEQFVDIFAVLEMEKQKSGDPSFNFLYVLQVIDIYLQAKRGCRDFGKASQEN